MKLISAILWTGMPSPAARRGRKAGVKKRFCSPSYETSSLASTGLTALTSCGDRTIAVTRTVNVGPSGAWLPCSTPLVSPPFWNCAAE